MNRNSGEEDGMYERRCGEYSNKNASGVERDVAVDGEANERRE